MIIINKSILKDEFLAKAITKHIDEEKIDMITATMTKISDGVLEFEVVEVYTWLKSPKGAYHHDYFHLNGLFLR